MAKTKKQTDKELLASILAHLKGIDWRLKESPNTWQKIRDVNIYEPTFFNKSLVPSLNSLAEYFNFVDRSAPKLPEPLAKEILALLARLKQGMSGSWQFARQFGNNEGWAICIGPKEVNDKIIEGYKTTYENEGDALVELIGKIGAEVGLEDRKTDDAEPVYIEINLATHIVTVGTKLYLITSDKVWMFIRILVDDFRQHKATPRKDGLLDWKNARDMLRKKIGKIATAQMITCSKGCYTLDPGVVVKGSGQMGFRRTK